MTGTKGAEKSNNMPDFETMIQEIGSHGATIPLKFVDEDNRIEEFLEAKKKYYQNMPTRGNVWKTDRPQPGYNPRFSTNIGEAIFLTDSGITREDRI